MIEEKDDAMLKSVTSYVVFHTHQITFNTPIPP